MWGENIWHKLLQEYKEKVNPSSNTGKTIQIVQDEFLATDFIFNSGQQRYNNMLRDLKNDNLEGLDA